MWTVYPSIRYLPRAPQTHILEVFSVNNLVFMWPNLDFSWFWGHMVVQWIKSSSWKNHQGHNMPQKDNVDGGHPGDYHANQISWESFLQPWNRWNKTVHLVCSMGRFLCTIFRAQGSSGREGWPCPTLQGTRAWYHHCLVVGSNMRSVKLDHFPPGIGVKILKIYLSCHHLESEAIRFDKKNASHNHETSELLSTCTLTTTSASMSSINKNM